MQNITQHLKMIDLLGDVFLNELQQQHDDYYASCCPNSRKTKKIDKLLPFTAPHNHAQAQYKKNLQASNTTPFIPNMGISVKNKTR